MDEEEVAAVARLTCGRNVNAGVAMAAVAVVRNTDGNISDRAGTTSPHDALEE